MGIRRVHPEWGGESVAEGGEFFAGADEGAGGLVGITALDFLDEFSLSGFDVGEASGFGIVAYFSVRVMEGMFGAVVEAGDAFEGEDESVGEGVAAGGDGVHAEAVDAIVILDEGDGGLAGIEAGGAGAWVVEGDIGVFR